MTPKPTKLDPTTLTADELRAALDYDPQTGVLTWRPRPREDFQFEHAFERFHADRAGKRAGKQYPRGTVVCLKTVQFPAEQLAWLHAHGEWPAGDIEFADGDPNNCALENLYEGDLPFKAGTGGPAHKRRVKPPRAPRKAVARPAVVPVAVSASPPTTGDVLARFSEELLARGVEQRERRRLLREAADLL